MENCPNCRHKLIRTVRDEEYSYKAAKIVVKQPQEYCENCGESYLSHEDIQATKKELADFRREQDNL